MLNREIVSCQAVGVCGCTVKPESIWDEFHGDSPSFSFVNPQPPQCSYSTLVGFVGIHIFFLVGPFYGPLMSGSHSRA